MTIDQYAKWANEIRQQQDLIISTQQYMRMCNTFIQDVWLDCSIPGEVGYIKQKANIMFELQRHFVK